MVELPSVVVPDAPVEALPEVVELPSVVLFPSALVPDPPDVVLFPPVLPTSVGRAAGTGGEGLADFGAAASGAGVCVAGIGTGAGEVVAAGAGAAVGAGAGVPVGAGVATGLSAGGEPVAVVADSVGEGVEAAAGAGGCAAGFGPVATPIHTRQQKAATVLLSSFLQSGLGQVHAIRKVENGKTTMLATCTPRRCHQGRGAGRGAVGNCGGAAGCTESLRPSWEKSMGACASGKPCEWLFVLPACRTRQEAFRLFGRLYASTTRW
ncbi:hypothetical protein ACWC5I_13160 [Kitasatospora sp. NPDC001574]